MSSNMVYKIETDGVKFNKIDCLGRYQYMVSFDIGHVINVANLAHGIINNEQNTISSIIESMNECIPAIRVLDVKTLTETLPMPDGLILPSSSPPEPYHTMIRHYFKDSGYDYRVFNYTTYPRTFSRHSSKFVTDVTAIIIHNIKLYDLLCGMCYITTLNKSLFNRRVKVMTMTNDLEVYKQLIQSLSEHNIKYETTLGGIDFKDFEIKDIGIDNRIEYHGSKNTKSYLELKYRTQDVDDPLLLEEYLSDYMKTYKHRTKVRKVSDNEYHINITTDIASIVEFNTMLGIKPYRTTARLSIYELYNIKKRSEVFNDYYSQ